MDSKKKSGQSTEQTARLHLEQSGLTWVASNVRADQTQEEIDLIMKDRDMLVFIEVRSRKNADHGHPLDSVTPQKQHQIIKAATVYLIKNHLYDKVACRFDVVSVMQIDGNNQLEWIKDAFHAHR